MLCWCVIIVAVRLRFSIHTIYPHHCIDIFIYSDAVAIFGATFGHTPVYTDFDRYRLCFTLKSFSGPFILAHFVCISVTFYRSLLRWVAHSLLFLYLAPIVNGHSRLIQKETPFPQSTGPPGTSLSGWLGVSETLPLISTAFNSTTQFKRF